MLHFASSIKQCCAVRQRQQLLHCELPNLCRLLQGMGVWAAAPTVAAQPTAALAAAPVAMLALLLRWRVSTRLQTQLEGKRSCTAC